MNQIFALSESATKRKDTNCPLNVLQCPAEVQTAKNGDKTKTEMSWFWLG